MHNDNAELVHVLPSNLEFLKESNVKSIGTRMKQEYIHTQLRGDTGASSLLRGIYKVSRSKSNSESGRKLGEIKTEQDRRIRLYYAITETHKKKTVMIA